MFWRLIFMKETKKVFIPLTLDNSTKHFFSSKQIIGIALFALGLLGVQLVAFQLYTKLLLTMSKPLWLIIPGDIIVTYLLIFFFRKIVLRENEMMRHYRDNQHLQKTDISFCWDIFAIKDSRVFYCNGMQGVLVCLSHGYLLDRPPDQEEIHRAAVKSALGAIVKQGFSFIYFNREVQDSNLGPLELTERRLTQFQNQPFYETANAIIKHTYNVCSAIANTEQEYYLFLANNFETIRKLDHAVKEFINMLQGGIYVKMEILDTVRIWQFISEQFGTSLIDPSTLLTKKFEDADVQMVKILEVNRDRRASTEVALEKEVPIAEQAEVEDWLKREWEQKENPTQSIMVDNEDILI